MTTWEYFLIPLYPFIAFICLLVFTYERLAQNEQERVGDKFTPTRALFMIWMSICAIVGFPAVLLGTFGGLIRWPIIIAFSPILLTWALLRNFVWNPLFQSFVPRQYGAWNDKVYRNVPVGPRQTRVLVIQPGTESAELVIRFEIFDLMAGIPEGGYDALSYSWGGHLMLRRAITVNDRSYFVADTVFNALKELRLPDRTRYLWIDAVCINQNDPREKSEQVALMGEIYLCARRTIIWFGKPTGQLKAAFAFIERISSVSTHRVAEECGNTRDWQPCMDELMRKRWWSRVWVVQEVGLAQDVVLRCGGIEITWETLMNCFRRLSTFQGYVLDGKILSFIDTVSKLQHSDDVLDRSLYALALRFRDRVAGDPRDKLLAYYGLAKNVEPSDLPVNPYNKTTPEVFAHFAASTIIRTGSLAIVALAENNATHKNTWVLDWEKLTSPGWRTNDPIALDNTPENPQPLLFWSEDPLSISERTGRDFSPAGDSRAIIRQAGSTWDSVLLTGWEEDTVRFVGNAFEDVRHTADVILNWTTLIDEVAPSKRADFVKVLVAEAWQGTLSSDWPQCFHQYLLGVCSQSKGASPALGKQEGRSTNVDSQIADGPNFAFNIMGLCCFRRRFFITEKGRFGLGPVKTINRDKIYVMLGSRVPFVLAPPFISNKHHFVGQAYVEDIMHYEGDLENDLKEGRRRTKDFLVE
ncbi:MAG: hypothetical protein Q9214_002530 [Letrouitia sp. 1 TL-2023]